MGMGLGHAVLSHVPMHIEIGDHAAIHEFAPNEVAGEFDALRLSHLARNGEFDLASQLGIFADFERLDIVPEPFAVAPHLRGVLRQHHLGMDDAALCRKNHGCDQAARRAAARPSGRRLTPPRWSQTCGQ